MEIVHRSNGETSSVEETEHLFLREVRTINRMLVDSILQVPALSRCEMEFELGISIELTR